MCKACNMFAAAVADFRAVDAEAEARDRMQAFRDWPKRAGEIARKHGLPTDERFWDMSGRDAAVRLISACAWVGEGNVEAVLAKNNMHAEVESLGWLN
jgi:hypothetical protein